MIISNPSYSARDGYPTLQVEVDGRRAELGSEASPTLHGEGLVFLGSDFEAATPPIDFKGPDGSETRLLGFSRDARLFRLYDRFLRDCAAGPIVEGPVAIPA